MTFVLRANDATRDQVLANCKRFLDMLPAEKSWRVEIAPFAKSRNHIDGVKHHCHYSNLEWCTRQENMEG